MHISELIKTMLNFTIILLIISVILPSLFGITTIHHDKPEDARISKMVTKMQEEQNRVPLNPTTFNAERQKRLLPYVNYYSGHNTYQKALNNPNYQLTSGNRNNINEYPHENEQITPFLDSNALPGPFVPIQQERIPSSNIDAYNIRPNFQEIYTKLAQLKQQNQQNHQNYLNNNYNKQTKTTIETFTPTQIDVSENVENNYENFQIPPNKNVIYKIYRQSPQITEQYLNHQQPNYQTQDYTATVENPPKYYKEKEFVTKPVYLYQSNKQPEKPIIYTIQPKPHVNTVIDNKYVAQKLISQDNRIYPSIPLKQYEPVQFIPQEQSSPSIENTNTLSHLLKQLQDTNTLPHTLTTDNIDNSIKTLIDILNNLKKNRAQNLNSKPIVVADENSEELENTQDEQQHEYAPGTVTQTFPANTIEGGTPGRPGIDYPALSSIPQTDFNCKTQRYKGFFGDPNTNCQVWHYCDLNGGQASFLCPNGTIFSQVALTCDWWYNVKCDNTAQLYVLNERLYKYILPLSPKFPEDYSGPLVDKYLALKFKEMEEKMSKEKKSEEKSDKEEDKDDSDQLQDIQKEKQAKEASTEDN